MRTLMLGLATFALLAAGSVTAQAQKVLRVALAGPVLTFDPANYRSRINENVIRNIFDALYTINTDGRHTPEIAESVTQVDDAVWEFRIRQGILFHNGDPLTAADVAFSYNRAVVEGAMDGQTSPRKELMGGLNVVEEVDAYTVRFHFEAPVSEIRVLTAAVLMQVMPKDYFERVGIEGFLAAPVGAGPFQLVEANFAERVVLDRFADYWGGAPDLLGTPGPAPADRLIFEVVPDPTARLAALRAGDLDVIQAVLPDQIPVIERDANVVLKTAPGTVVTFIAFNTQRAPFDDPRVRRAVAHAIDYDALVEHVYGGLADPLNGITTIWNTEIHHPDQQPYLYDPELARRELAEAGASNVTLVIDAVSTWALLAEAVAQMLGDVGIDAQVRVWEVAAMTAAAQAGEHQAVVHAWGNSSGEPHWVESTNNRTTGFTLWEDVGEFWELLAEAPGIANREEREDVYRRIFDLHNENLPLITLVLPQALDAARANVLHFEAHPTGRVNMHRVDLATP